MTERPLISCPGDRPPPHPGGTYAQLVDAAERDGGPHRAWEPVVAHLRAEQALDVATLLAGLDPGPGRQPSAPTDTETRP